MHNKRVKFVPFGHPTRKVRCTLLAAYAWRWTSEQVHMKQVECSSHGKQGIGLVCKHIAFAIDEGRRVGFFWGDDVDTARPDAWCSECDKALVALNGASSAQWFKDAEFKIFCACCWDEAKAVCGGFTNS